MKSYSIAKYNINSVKKPIGIFYFIFITVLLTISVVDRVTDGAVTSSGLELSTIIFLFVLGLNLFKEGFYFSQANNISRETYFKGTIISMIPIAAVLSAIDVIINRIYNIAVSSPTNFDMIYTGLTDLQFETWIQSNTISILFQTFLFQFAVYSMIIATGLVVTMIYYRANKLMKVVVSVVPIMLIILGNLIMGTFPEKLPKVFLFIQNIFGWSTRNPYVGILTFTITFIILAICGYILIKKAVIKER